MADVEDVVNNQDISDLVEEILKASTSSQADLLQNSYKNIINKAKEFNAKYQEAQSIIEEYQRELKTIMKDWQNDQKDLSDRNIQNVKSTNEYKRYLKQRETLKTTGDWGNVVKVQKNIAKLGLQFQKIINAAISQKVTTVYVWQSVGKTKRKQTYIVDNMSDFLTVDTDRDGNVVTRYRDNLALLKEHGEKLESSINEKDTLSSQEYDKLLKTYDEVVNRYLKYKTRVLWLNPDYSSSRADSLKWHGYIVSNQGNLKERYGSVLLSGRFVYRDIKEDNIEEFFSITVTNLKGRLSGDKTTGNIQNALKSLGASTLSLDQLYEISSQIVKKIDFQEIQKYLWEKKKEDKKQEWQTDKNLRDHLKDIVSDSLEQAISELDTKI